VAGGARFRPKFAFVILVCCRVGALTGVRGFSAAFHSVLKREARTLMAADFTSGNSSSLLAPNWPNLRRE